MTTIMRTSTLAEIVTTDPDLSRHLERRGLDYCCGGARTIEHACLDQGLDVGTVLAELSRAAADRPAPDWAGMDAGRLVDHIEITHHRYLWTELPRLSALM